MNSRIEYLLKKLDEDGILNVNDLADEFHVSSATIRRDLSSLEQQGKLKRIPGGAIKPSSGSVMALETDFNMSSKLQLNSVSKKKVCEIACKEIQDGECIFIDGGTTSAYMFKLLQNRPVTIVTNNHLFASQITPPTTARIIMVGGIYMSDFAMTYGPTAVNQIQDIILTAALSPVSALIFKKIMHTVLKSRPVKSKISPVRNQNTAIY